jgi:hypothetical protein
MSIKNMKRTSDLYDDIKTLLELIEYQMEYGLSCAIDNDSEEDVKHSANELEKTFMKAFLKAGKLAREDD